jgi:uncharacterized protein YndB with AHSA1/START domain
VEYETSVRIDAPPEKVWRVLTDVERWPEWTPSMTRVERLQTGPLQVGSTARIKQPKFPPTVWRVTELEPGRSFSWAAGGPGVATVGGHRMRPAASVAVAPRFGGFLFTANEKSPNFRCYLREGLAGSGDEGAGDPGGCGVGRGALAPGPDP